MGAGPVGLRLAIECALLGARCLVVEKRDRFSRHNVLHLWPYVITDLKNLGAKVFYGKFATGQIEHISKPDNRVLARGKRLSCRHSTASMYSPENRVAARRGDLPERDVRRCRRADLDTAG